jgi:hypothetical protein
VPGRGHLGDFGPAQGEVLRPGGRAGLPGQRVVADHGNPVAPPPVPGLPPSDGDQPGPDAAVTPERPGPAPGGQHRVLQDFLAGGRIPGHQVDLREHDPPVPVLQLAQRLLVTGRGPAQQPGVADGRRDVAMASHTW